MNKKISGGAVLVWIALLVPAFCGAAPVYEIDVKVDVEASRIEGKGRIVAGRDSALRLHAGALENFRIGGEPGTRGGGAAALDLKEGKSVSVEFEGNFNDPAGAGIVREGAVSLAGAWYPVPDRPVVHRLTVELPAGYTAVSEAERIEVERRGARVVYRFDFPHPVERVHLVASDRYEVKRETYGGVAIVGYFFEEDRDLWPSYRDYTKRYLDLYQGLLTDFPFHRFAVVENVLPTGYSMPTFTLLGRAVVKLPFIVKTSLGHEILHQWFGNSVYIDNASGNWAEGLVTYLADHLYEALEGRGGQYRKRMLIDLAAYADAGRSFPLSEFRSRRDRASKAVGYDKSAMVFHALQRRTGEETFHRALRRFVGNNRFHRAGWRDLKTAMEEESGENLEQFFKQWLEREDLPEIGLEELQTVREEGRYRVSFVIALSPGAYRLRLPVQIVSKNGTTERVIKVSGENTEASVRVDAKPLGIAVDPDYDVPRRLAPAEYPPVLARAIGAERPVLLADGRTSSFYFGFSRLFEQGEPRREAPSGFDPAASNADVVVIFGRDGVPVVSGYENAFPDLPVASESRGADFLLAATRDPNRPERVLIRVHADSAEAFQRVARKLSHYGRYSTLAFRNGRNVLKKTAESSRGMRYNLR